MGTNKTTVAVGCIFEFFGKIPENVYNSNEKLTLLEKAVYDNDPETIKQLVAVSFFFKYKYINVFLFYKLYMNQYISSILS